MTTALTGFMMSGKTLVGRELANRLSRRFIDLDQYIEKKEGLSIASIISSKGERFFREREKKCLEEILTAECTAATDCGNLVLSLGGGTLMDPENLSMVKRHCTLVWLRTTPEETAVLLSEKGNASLLESRPLLKGANLQTLFTERLPGYMAADFYVDTATLTVLEIVSEIQGRFNASSRTLHK